MEGCLKRRRLIRLFVLGSSASWCAGAWKTEAVLAVETPAVRDEVTLRLRPESFPALNTIGGSVRLNVGLDQPVVISRASANGFYAVNSRCGHLGCTVGEYDDSTHLIRCPCHGSTYNIDGSLAGGPAQRGLEAYETTFDGVDEITVRITGASFAARDISIVSNEGDGKRIKLTFFPSSFTSYQVSFRRNLTDAPQVIPFSLTPTGDAGQTIYRNSGFNPDDPTPLIPLYVDAVGPQGFFSIAVVVTEYEG
ncbi:MAG: Rieske (2Fe-2S) protein [Luteolibacter sp.]|uniref:Rieske (2Fe-2S) protein n=1 Tax=Luteolibacter sp. TaxID=1962973 RepID=UPI0032632FA1